MYGNKVENPGDISQKLHEFQAFQEELLHQNQQQHHYNLGGMARSQASSDLSWSNIPPVHTINSVQFAPNRPIRDLSLCVPPPSNYSGIYNPMTAASLQFSADEGSSSNHLGLAGLHGGSAGLVQGGSAPFCLQTELGKMTTQEMMDAKALSASKSHSEAERRRRERINKHLARLRSLLPSTTKTDKASLLAEVIQHVKDLKRQTSEMAEENPIPTEVDELTVDATDKDGDFVFKASLCCDDRSDLLPDIIKTLKALRLRTLKAEITTLGGRVKNVLLIAGEEDSNNRKQSISSIQEALKAVMERTDSGGSSSTVLKRQKTNISMI